MRLSLTLLLAATLGVSLGQPLLTTVYDRQPLSSPTSITAVKALPGERMMKAGRALTISGAALLVGGYILMSSADDNYANFTNGNNQYVTYAEDPQRSIGRIIVIYGAGATITGIILWSKGSKKMTRYKEREGLTLNAQAHRLTLRYKF